MIIIIVLFRFILSPSCSTLLHYYKYDVKSKKYEAVSFVRMPDSRNEEISGLCIKCIDFQHHAFTATVSDKSLHFGDPETFQFIDRILHPSAIWSHRISQLCPFNVISKCVTVKYSYLFIFVIRLLQN